MTHDYFKDYREAHDEMVTNKILLEAQVELILAETKMLELKAPYKERMRKAEEGIYVITIDQQRTVILHGVEAKYIKPRKSTKWKAVAMCFKPKKELIEEYSTVGSPTVRISVHEVLDLEE